MGRFPAQGIATLARRTYSWSIRIRRVALSRNSMLIRILSLNMPARPDIDAKLSRKAITTVILHGSHFDEACPLGAPARLRDTKHIERDWLAESAETASGARQSRRFEWRRSR